MAIDIIYKYETKFDDDHKFSIDLLSNNEIQNMVFKECDKWLATGLKLRFKSDLINKIKADQKNNITHGEIHTKLPNLTSFDHDILTCLTLPDNKTYGCYNVEIKKMDVINFPDYKKRYKENKAVWNSRDYGNA